jgi:hypothetical protein
MEHKNSINKEYYDAVFTYRERAISLAEVSLKFQDELKRLHLNNLAPDNNEQIKNRSAKAATYFSAQSMDILKQMQETSFVTDNKQIELKLHALEKELYEYWHKKYALWQALTDGFNSGVYFNAIKSYRKPRLIKADSGSKNGDTASNRSLKQILLLLRDELCEEHQLPAYRVATLQTIEALCEALPQNEQELLQVKGFGQSRVRQFGTQFLQLIQDYCRMNHVNVSASTKTYAVKKKTTTKVKTATHEITAQLFKEGKSLTEIATTRSLTTGTIESHLAYSVSKKMISAEEILDLDKLNLILTEIKNNPRLTMLQLKQVLPQHISFGEIRIAMSHIKLNETVSSD